MHDAAFVNANLATMREGTPYGAVLDGVVAVTGGSISWVGPRADWRDKAREEHDARGAWITPGLIDRHTHLVYAGNRAHEFELRLKGATYEEIARAGGGILSTVRATRAATEEQLLQVAQTRLQRWQAEGVTTIEIKSGYGLDRDTELKMLRVARALGAVSGSSVETTFLGAHALPPEYDGRAGRLHRARLRRRSCPRREGRASPMRSMHSARGSPSRRSRPARVFEAAKALGLPVKLHADQLSDLGGAALAARHAALSADHIEYFERRRHCGDESRRHGGGAPAGRVLFPRGNNRCRRSMRCAATACRIALATDHNPGSSPLSSPLLMLNMACTLFRLTPEEALAGMTRNAARALGLQATHGMLEPGKRGRPRVVGHRRARRARLRDRCEPLHPVEERPEVRPHLAGKMLAEAERRLLLHVHRFGKLELHRVHAAAPARRRCG